jgi:DNA mismatch repair protein MutS
VPVDYVRKQTIAGGERFTTPASRISKIVCSARTSAIGVRELELFEALRARVAPSRPRPRHGARARGARRAAGLADVAATANYTKPRIHDGDEFSATDARHPIVERHRPTRFVPNDVDARRTRAQLVILTGPNMGGKSTYLRQIALLALMAQAGSFVPAQTAKLAVVDRIFARVGRVGQHRAWQSTFMVEMQETATILHSATSRSLVILDEIGRGTATFDGMSLAWAVAEHLASNKRARPKTVFATHYHELTDLRTRARRRQPARGRARVQGRHHLFCTRSSRGDPIAATAFRWRGSRACPRRSSPGRPTSSKRSSSTNCAAVAVPV